MTEEENYLMFKISRKWTYRPEKAFLWSICICKFNGETMTLSWHQIIPGNEKRSKMQKPKQGDEFTSVNGT